MKHATACTLLLLIWVVIAQAIPQQVNYQGQLTSNSGLPLDTTVAMTFKLYNGSGGGATLLWTESHPSIVVSAGLFNHALGSLTAFNDTLLGGAEVWLGVTVGNNTEMTPRARIVSVGYSYRVGTVDGASGGTISGKLNVGNGNTNTGNFANVQGENNLASGNYATVGGGRYNFARASWSVVGGGGGFFGEFDSNSVRSEGGTIGGGRRNYCASSPSGGATIGGGIANSATWDFATVAGGVSNVAGGQAFVGGGEGNQATGSGSVISGGTYNDATNTSTTISGGNTNTVSSYLASIGGGQGNQSSGLASRVGGGRYNRARGDYSVVGGGGGPSQVDSNSAIGEYSVVSGGNRNRAAAPYSTVAGGFNNSTTGYASFVCGSNVQAVSANAFSFGDGSALLTPGVSHTASFLTTGGFRIYTNSAQTAGLRLAAGGSAWITHSDSTKKRNRRNVDTKVILEKVSQIPIQRWSYKSQDESIEHIGPMAQDFWREFHLGEDSLAISTIDPSGIALAAIQELVKENSELRQRLTRLETQLQTYSAGEQKTEK